MSKKLLLSLIIPSLLMVSQQVNADDDEKSDRRGRSSKNERSTRERQGSERGRATRGNRDSRKDRPTRVTRDSERSSSRRDRQQNKRTEIRESPFSKPLDRRATFRTGNKVNVPNSSKGIQRGNRQPQSITRPRRENLGSPRNNVRVGNQQARQKTGQLSKDNLRRKHAHRRDRSKSYRSKFRDHRKRHHIFDDNYWVRFRRNNKNWYFDNNFAWFGVLSWPRVSTWLPGRWDNTVYYYYEGDRIYYSMDTANPYLMPLESDNAYYINAITLANSSPKVSTNQNDWMSLGTFAVYQETDTLDMPQEFISLAVSKNGAVSGAYVNTDNNIPIQIEGAVDENSQRIAWKFVGKNWPVMETGLYNLTEEESTILVHLSRFRSEAKVITRVNN